MSDMDEDFMYDQDDDYGLVSLKFLLCSILNSAHLNFRSLQVSLRRVRQM